MVLGGLLSVVTMAMALAMGGMPAEATKRSFKDISSRLTKGSSHRTKTTKSIHRTSTTRSSGTKTVSASVQCSSSAYANTYSDSESSYIKAVTNVIKDVCSSNFTGSTVKATQKMTGFAKAWAHATAKTAAKCVSKSKNGGKAQGCAYASASAKAFEKAFASAHASASAEAFAKYCTCADAEAWAFGDIDVFKKLAAEAFAEAKAAACASGANEESSATASAEREAVLVLGARRLASARGFFGPRYVTETEDSEHARAGIDLSNTSASVDCQAHIFAQTYAFAAAKASVTGQCYGKHKSDKARADIEARVNAQVYDTSKCSVELKRKGRSGAKTQARASTRTKSVHKGTK